MWLLKHYQLLLSKAANDLMKDKYLYGIYSYGIGSRLISKKIFVCFF